MNIPPPVRADDKYRDLLREVHSREDIPETWKDTPIESFMMAQNFGWPIAATGKVELLIATCIEFRYSLPIPKMYAYVIRRASGRVIGSEFSVGYTLSQGVRYLIIIGHNDCGMSKVYEKAPLVVQAFMDQGWEKEAAEEYVKKQVTRHAISDELEALHEEYLRLRSVFRKLVIAPLFVCLHDSKLYIPSWLSQTQDEQATNGTVPNELIRTLP
ncbi:MAG: hypothetical protein C0507_18905 [Cyanobacteria bacterium PR.3.49]|nr:hypothetical protein [Cyanobacteria bacterium PR.3.49]